MRLAVENPEVVRVCMPPWAGTPEEAEILTRFLKEISATRPSGLRIREVPFHE